MTRFIIVAVLLASLLSLATIEQVFIGRTYAKMKRDTEALYSTINKPTNAERVDLDEHKAMIDNIYYYWLKQERKLCLVARHLDLSYISDAIIYARNFIYFDNREEACAGLARLIYLIDTHKYNIVTSVQNVI